MGQRSREVGMAPSTGGGITDNNSSIQPVTGPSVTLSRCNAQSSVSSLGPALVLIPDRLCRSGSNEGPDSLKTRQCRICFDTEDLINEPDNPLVSPCLCAGGSRFVHRKCLQLWREAAKASGREKGFFTCEVCAYEYQFSRLDSAQWLLHPAFVPVMFTLTLAVSVWLLGYIPIFETLDCEVVRHTWCRHNKEQCHMFNGSRQCKYSTKVTVALHLLDGLFMLGQLGLLIYRWKKDPSPPPPPQSSSRPEVEDPSGCSLSHEQCCTEEHLTAQENRFGQSWACGCCLLAYSTTVGLTLTVTKLLEWLYIYVDRLATNTAQIIENIDSKSRREPGVAHVCASGSSSTWRTVALVNPRSSGCLGRDMTMRCMAKWYFFLCLVAVTITTIALFATLMKSPHSQ